MIRFPIKKQPGATDLLTGATLGQRHAAALRLMVLDQEEEQPVVLLDFEGIKFVSSSYIKSAVLGLIRESVIQGGVERYAFPVVSNVASEWKDELDIVCRSEELVALELARASGDSLLKVRLHGEADATLLRTLDTLKKVGRGTAAQLAEAAPGESINLTAWNNRLAELFRLRLAQRVKEGRFLVYELVAKEIIYG
jgi:hypothetical protein